MKDGQGQIDAVTTHQSRMLFKPASWLTKIDFINHLILFNNVLITVLSEKEGGKTSFSTLLQNNLDKQIKSIYMTIKPPCDREQIINDIATQLHLNNDAHTDIASIVAQINERKAHMLLILDEGEEIPESLIKELLMAIKNQEDFGFFHLCLVSDYSVVATLNHLSEQFNNLIHTIELGSLSESEARTYVLQRAMTERLINKPLSDQQLKQFYQLTKGNVAKINANLESFIFKCATQKPRNNLLFLKRACIGVSAVIAAGLSYMYYDSSYTKGQFPHEENLTAPSAVEHITVNAKPKLLVSHIASLYDSSTIQLVEYALPKKQILDDIDDEGQQLNTVAIVDKVVVIPTVNSPNTPLEPQLGATIAVQESRLEKIVGFSATKPVKIAKATKVTKKVSATSKVNLYTIQLAASHNISDVKRFKQSNKLLSATKLRHFTNAKGHWYILTLGEYNSRDQAQVHAKKLPAQLAKLNPWIRPVAGLS
jgi:hypothetical protein